MYKNKIPNVPERKPSKVEAQLITKFYDPDGPITTEFDGVIKTILDPKKQILMRNKNE